MHEKGSTKKINYFFLNSVAKDTMNKIKNCDSVNNIYNQAEEKNL